MELFKVVIAGLLGTIFMTSFSYIVSIITSRQFKEPRLLNMILRRSNHEHMNPSNNSIIGWVLHFSIGIILMTLFNLFRLFFSFNISLISLITYGIISGILAILSWHLMFYISSRPPDIALKGFYIQLFFAHILFAFGAIIFMY
ncbi:hypothetical protein [Gramella sp. MAR_2010_147]|uniref:hypothetical protein n=1 Tax=Gramella sp. MAR_2010_147 TaxID=1250205 RepID=UPI00087C11C1|nr:hypothetical protein [Gramella sp. MAR_2010_147]SDS23291.1 hypothetical protein SAMN04488553_1782 [Gramella sp. MAR_2010_147]